MAIPIEQSRLSDLCSRGASDKTGGYDVLLKIADGEIAASHAPGLFDERENVGRYRLGCIQDMCYGAVIFSLSDAGLIDPRSRIGEYLPELGNQPGSPGAHIRVLDLLSHSAGYFLPAGESGSKIWSNWQSMASFLVTAIPSFPAGQVVSYAGVEAAILPELIRRVTRQEVYDVIYSRLLAPAGLCTETGCQQIELSELSLTLRELVLLVQHLQDCFGLHDGGRLFQALQRNAVPVFRSPRLASPFLPLQFSYGFAGFLGGAWGQNGRSQTHCLTIRMNFGSNYILALATAGTEFRRNRVARQIADALCEVGAPEQTPGLMGELHMLDGKMIAGLYYGSDGYTAEVIAEDSLLRCKILKNGNAISEQQGVMDVSGKIFGDAKWWTLGIEFFPHPDYATPCMMFGPHAFIKADQYPS